MTCKFTLKDIKQQIDFDEVYIDEKIVLRFLGYGSRNPPETIIEIVQEEIAKVNNLLDIDVYAVEIKNFKDKYKSFAVLYSIGDRINDEINHLMENYSMMASLALDKIGVVALDFVNAKVKEFLKLNFPHLNISNEVYPGSKDFGVENQTMIYNSIKSEFSDLTISINEYHQLSPIKSVALVILIGKGTCTVSRCDKCENKCF